MKAAEAAHEDDEAQVGRGAHVVRRGGEEDAQEVGDEAEDKHTIKIKRFSFWYFDLTNLLI